MTLGCRYQTEEQVRGSVHIQFISTGGDHTRVGNMNRKQNQWGVERDRAEIINPRSSTKAVKHEGYTEKLKTPESLTSEK